MTLHVMADPRTLPNGTFTATVIVTIEGAASSRVRSHGTTTSIPITVNLVTPVTPKPSKEAASQHAIIVPAVGHLDGQDSHWQSDVRITNAGFRNYKYRLTFTPAGGTALGVKETNVTVDAGATIALDDIVKNWFGQGSLGDGASGMLEILPLEDAENAAKVTVASSRTYNVTANGTLGQFIPAVPFPSFIGRAAGNALPTILGLQQIAQTKSYRTNVGIVEGSGQPVQALINVFNAQGTKLLSIPTQLVAGQQLQLNGLLAANNLSLDDGRIEVQVTGGNGKITAYASVIDGDTGDPLLVSATPLTGSGATKYVLPGVTNINSAFANWRTDMRVFNYGTTPQSATLTFYPVGNPARVAQIVANPGEVLTLDNIVKTLFDGEGLGGAVHLTTPQPAPFVVTGRTYNQTEHGTFGQFIPAVTVGEAVGKGGRTLHILQVEDSVRYRTNVGLTEVSGQPALVELQVVLPDSKITPTVQVPLAANEFRQFSLIRDLGLGNAYNARIAVRVIDGTGRVTAYGSVIDETTNDPTY
ncbi:MAG TPA: hypothetical protein VHL59_09075, partial [Thermoanaerobaculia bacterium]|nr:hypothetical protein [Thermoanaerobaculia bacterium]